MSTFLLCLAAIATYHALIFYLNRWLNTYDAASTENKKPERTFQERLDEKKNGLSK